MIKQMVHLGMVMSMRRNGRNYPEFSYSYATAVWTVHHKVEFQTDCLRQSCIFKVNGYFFFYLQPVIGSSCKNIGNVTRSSPLQPYLTCLLFATPKEKERKKQDAGRTKERKKERKKVRKKERKKEKRRKERKEKEGKKERKKE